jgi:molybdenum cofactor cytidylyltransferase
MPFVGPDTLIRLRENMEQLLARGGHRVILQPWHDDRPGHPVGFGDAHFGVLATLTGDEGARRVLRDAAADVVRLEVDDPGVLQDLDEPP